MFRLRIFLYGLNSYACSVNVLILFDLQVSHFSLLSSFPFFSVSSPSFLAAMVMVLVNHYLAFSFFGENYYPFSEVSNGWTTELFSINSVGDPGLYLTGSDFSKCSDRNPTVCLFLHCDHKSHFLKIWNLAVPIWPPIWIVLSQCYCLLMN